MVLPRPSTLRGFAPARLLRSTPRTEGRTQWQQIARRGYASEGGHGAHAASSDLPWLISGIAVTIPSCWFLWPEASHADAHGAHAAHGDHEEEHEEAEESKEEPEEAPAEDDAPKEESKPDDTSAEESKDEAPEQDKDHSRDELQSNSPEEGESKSKRTSDGENMPENKGNVEGVQFKGKTSAGDDDNEMPDVRKREPDSKGAFKKRIDSAAGKNLGEGAELAEDGRSAANSAKPVTDHHGAIDKKQQGLSNTPTRHSTDIGQDPEKSKKGEGIPETAKSMGTVDSRRPQAESPDRGSKA